MSEVARQQLTIQARFSRASLFTAAVRGRYNGVQFEDDQNLLRLEPFVTLDAFISRRISPRLELFAAAENLTNQRYSIGRTPVRNVGPPTFVRAGFRLSFGR